METIDLSQKIPSEWYTCIQCDYNTFHKNDFNKHLLTSKHKRLINTNQNSQKNPIDNLYMCDCGKSYKHTSSLWKHKKICIKPETQLIKKDETQESIDKDQLIIMLIKQNSEMIKENSEFKNMMMEVIKNGTTNNTTNSHNKSFNLQFFLNETCKDAMNIMDFVDSIKLQLSDFENIGDMGYVEGISNIIVKNLNKLDITQRPIHCADKKREVMYIKDDDKWEKEDDKKTKIRKAIKRVASKNHKLILTFREKYPDYNKYSSPNSTRYDKLIIEAMGGMGDNDLEKEDKIIRNITKNVIIDKIM